jgi:hypothetical protein
MTAKALPTLTVKQVERFWKRVNKSDDCWVWTGPDKLTINKIKYKPARIAYALTYGMPSDTGCVVRLCETHGCVNPLHLKDVTAKEAGIRSRIGNILAIRKSGNTAPMIALNTNKPLELIDAIRRGKIL